MTNTQFEQIMIQLKALNLSAARIADACEKAEERMLVREARQAYSTAPDATDDANVADMRAASDAGSLTGSACQGTTDVTRHVGPGPRVVPPFASDGDNDAVIAVADALHAEAGSTRPRPDAGRRGKRGRK